MSTQKIKDFFTKYNGRYIDWDGYYGYQCVDLMRYFQVEALGYPAGSIPAAGYAKDIFKNFAPNQYFDKIYNGPYNVPQLGDIVFWGTYPFVTGIAGHVAIFSEGDVYNLVTFDQNYPTGSPCHFYKHSYRGVMGWLHPKI